MNEACHIDGVDWQVRHLPLVTPLKTARQTYKKRQILLLRLSLRRSDGTHVLGFGECAPLPGWSKETIPSCKARLASLSLVERPVLSGELGVFLGELEDLPSLRFALELGLIDALARADGITLRAWLGRRAGQGGVRHTVALQTTLGIADDTARLDAAVSAVSQGAQAIKLKVGGDDEPRELAFLTELRRRCPEVAIRLDANGAWSLKKAREIIPQIAPLGIDILEQPLAASDWSGLVALAHWAPMTIAADEALYASEDGQSPAEHARKLMAAGLEALIIKPMAFGGLLPALQLARVAADDGKQIILSSLIESAVGRRAVAQLAAACPTLAGPHGLATGHWLAKDLADAPDAIIGDQMTLSDGPGLGFSPPMDGESLAEVS